MNCYISSGYGCRGQERASTAHPRMSAFDRLRAVPRPESEWPRCLEPEQELRGDVMTTAARDIVLAQPDAIVLSGYTTASILNGRSPNLPRDFTLTSFGHIYFIVHDNMVNHWSLASWKTSSRTLAHYDSVSPVHKPQVTKLRNWIAAQTGHKISVRSAPCPQQSGSVDCGLYALHFLGLLVGGCAPYGKMSHPPSDSRALVAARINRVISSLPPVAPVTPTSPSQGNKRQRCASAAPASSPPRLSRDHTEAPGHPPSTPAAVRDPAPQSPPRNQRSANARSQAAAARSHANRAAKSPTVVVNQHFPQGQSSRPGLAPTTHGEDLLKALQEVSTLQEAYLTSLPEGISLEQRRAHVRMAHLLTLHARVRPALLELPPSVWLCRSFASTARVLGWSPSTRRTHLGSLMGLLERLDQYAPSHQAASSLRSSSALKDLSRQITREFNRTRAATKPFLPFETMQSMMSDARAPDQETMLLLVVCWATSCRPTNGLRLHKENFTLRADGQISVMFTDAKTTTKRGPYTVHARLTPETYALLASYIENLPGSAMFPTLEQHPARALNRLRQWIRRYLPRATLRMIRRGSLIHLAESGATQEVLLNRSGHTTPKSLHDYLGAQLHLRVLRTELATLPATL